MKKVVDGLKYDTGKAELIGEYDNVGDGASSTTDFKHYELGIYRTKSGRYFLAGEGGPMSMFAHSIDQNSWSGGSDIIPLSKEEAYEYAEKYFDEETISEYFGDMVEDA